MFKIKILAVGRIKEKWIEEGIDHYAQRLKPVLLIEWIILKNDEQLMQAVSKENSYICLDPKGKVVTSEQFSQNLELLLEKHHSRLTLIIGGPEGIPQEIKGKAQTLLSLSSMTFTHQLIRLILLEQIYRAFEIMKGSLYHK